MKKIVILCGPTAVGKSALAIKLAKEMNAEIVSADSQQVWRELDLGTAKPTIKDQREVRHHLIDVATPGEHFDVARYLELAHAAIDDILKRRKKVLVVGGAGMYIRALLSGLCETPPQDLKIRETLMQKASDGALPELLKRLHNVDPITAKKLHPNDKTRIIRALEVFDLTGQTISHFHKQHAFKTKNYDALMVGLNIDREILRVRIDKRVDWMIACGWLEEIKELLRFYSASSQALQSIGYRQLIAHLRGERSLEDAIADIKKQTKAFARRQLTWFRGETGIQWFDPAKIEKIRAFIKQ